MKISRNHIFFIISLLASSVYMAIVSPDITRAYSIVGFFAFGALSIFFAVKLVLGWLRLSTSVNLVALSTTLGILYLIALSTLNSFRLVDVLIVLVVVVLIVMFVIKPHRKA